jgi:isopentenyl-diphosphate Delta-isomerase
MLLQQRAKTKYHCGTLWSNTCCGHPEPNETTDNAVHRRLQEENGFDCPMKEVFTFTYKAVLDKGLTEWEFDHVFIGEYNGDVNPDPEEADDYKWILPEEVKADLKAHPEKYTPWFKIVFDRAMEYKKKN